MADYSCCSVMFLIETGVVPAICFVAHPSQYFYGTGFVATPTSTGNWMGKVLVIGWEILVIGWAKYW